MEREIVLSTTAPDEVTVYQFVNARKHLTGKNYTRIFNLEFCQLAKDKSFTVTDFRVLIGLFKYMEYDNVIDCTQAQLATDLEITQALISRSLKKLESKGVLEISGKKGRQNVYRLNPYLGFKGYGKDLKEQQRGNFPLKTFNGIEDQKS